MMHPKIACL